VELQAGVASVRMDRISKLLRVKLLACVRAEYRARMIDYSECRKTNMCHINTPTIIQ